MEHNGVWQHYAHESEWLTFMSATFELELSPFIFCLHFGFLMF